MSVGLLPTVTRIFPEGEKTVHFLLELCYLPCDDCDNRVWPPRRHYRSRRSAIAGGAVSDTKLWWSARNGQPAPAGSIVLPRLVDAVPPSTESHPTLLDGWV